ncbi:MAG: tyrosine--tRNA ligase [Ignavibacteria bacterium]|nr:tyrosine--tRNA ligase [Ignavibacteria bacterium]
MRGTLNEQMDTFKRGVAEIIPEDELVYKIEKSIKTKQPLNIKLGCDPSKPDLHIGHAVVLNKLREFQDFGHKAILIIGDYTAMIGDPSGKKKTRPQLSFEETREYGKTYFEQATKILDTKNIEIRYNSEWLSKLTLADLLNIQSKFTVQRILERDDFRNRLQEEIEISMQELLYPIMQGYDSLVINSDVELGGTDQKFNNLIGRDMQRKFGKEPQVVLLMPLLEGTDGSEKMSKSLGNAIGICEPPKEIYGKAMSIPDNLIYKYFELGTRKSKKELDEIKQQLSNPTTNPRDVKKKLAFELVKLYYSEEEAKKSEEEFERVFSKKGLPDEIPEFITNSSNNKLIDILVNSKSVESKSAARRLIEQGGVTIDGEKIADVSYQLSGKKEFIIKAGKKKFLKVKII